MDYEGQICRAPMERSSFMLPVMDAHIISVNSVIYSGI